MANVRTRFAPSPTGFLHVGGLRTALYNYLFAKHHKGQFLLRIEDTDQERKVKGATESLIRVLNDFWLEPDEDPIYQSKRKEEGKYQKYAENLIQGDRAYYCFCSKEDLDKIREQQKKDKQPPGYWGKYRKCSHIDTNEASERAQKENYVVRFKMSDKNNAFKYGSELPEWFDLIHGRIAVDTQYQEDFIMIKSDGFPTYNFANVIDDKYMEITHVIRGEEFMPSTIKHIALYYALGWKKSLPAFAHLPLILNPDRSKLSKRESDVAVEDYLEKGFLRDALINFIALLGWNPGEGSEEEIFSLKDLIKKFDIAKVHKGGAIFDIEKLEWMNGLYIRNMKRKDLTELCFPFLQQYDSAISKEYAEKVIAVEQERLKKINDITKNTSFFFQAPVYEADLLKWKKSDLEGAKKMLGEVKMILRDMEGKDFTEEKLEKNLIGWIKKNKYGVGDVLWPLRVALSGLQNSPGPFEIAAVLGKEEVLKRINTAISKIA